MTFKNFSSYKILWFYEILKITIKIPLKQFMTLLEKCHLEKWHLQKFLLQCLVLGIHGIYLKSLNMLQEATPFPDGYFKTQSPFQNAAKPGILIFNESWLRVFPNHFKCKRILTIKCRNSQTRQKLLKSQILQCHRRYHSAFNLALKLFCFPCI